MGTGVMGHMGDEAHGHNFLNSAGIYSYQISTGHRHKCVLIVSTV